MYVRPHLVVFLWCAMLTEGLTEGRRLRTRRGVCENGTYQHEGRSCCFCQTGHRFLSHCTDKHDTKCEWCGHGTYIDHPNNDDKCQPCQICDSNANMDTMLNCSSSSNTVCRCKDNYYCDKGDLCKACYPCDTCEKHGVKEKCTETTNTVCHDAKEPVHLQDLDLDPYLLDIVEVLDWKTVKRVARRSGMRNTEIEEHELNNKNDVKEQKYTLLQAWSQRQGLRGAYPALIKTLHEMKQRKTADEIQTIVEKGQTE
ncbi:tumor necrosis factor receptor superfamily member 6-like isoform X2 [Sinocyclocheilus grahami]|uniref:tumor necrosis factor receptor superfamily member 6-like isoform X2 n=1 Tax=Sinocyclocheilus grahami TaxID=75366 RepID=UPI0007AC83BC|nr:PREDICTED: tumor necrosis factor receptor superfamily member 6-like isoform X2 [Sinocyclocheilus grahami]